MTDRSNSYQDYGSHLSCVWHELFDANTHFHIVNSLRGAMRKGYLNIGYATTFWGYTIDAHVSESISHLCRVYDKHKSAVHLRFLLETVRDNPQFFCKKALRQRLGTQPDCEKFVDLYGEPDVKQIARDLGFLDRKATPLVAKLVKWRHEVVAHRNRDVSVDFESFKKQWPLKREDIEELINAGFAVLDRCAGWYKAYGSYSRLPSSRGEKEYLHIVDALATAPRKDLYELISKYEDY